jgi:hypothetical protein
MTSEVHAVEEVKSPAWQCRLGITCERPDSPRVDGACTGCAQPELTPEDLRALVGWHRKMAEFCTQQDYHNGAARHEQRARYLERFL